MFNELIPIKQEVIRSIMQLVTRNPAKNTKDEWGQIIKPHGLFWLLPPRRLCLLMVLQLSKTTVSVVDQEF